MPHSNRPRPRRHCQLGAEEAKLPRVQPPREYTSAHEGSPGRIAPGSEGALAGGAALAGGKTMAAELELIVDRSMGGENLLGVAGSVTPPHVALAASGRLVRHLTAVVEIPALPIFSA